MTKEGGIWLNSYEINTDTMLLIPINPYKTKIIERNSTFNINQNCFEILKASCEYFGSSYEVRRKATTKLIGITHKVPIVVEDYTGLIFFPTISPREEKCMWICLQEIKSYYKEKHKTVIEFHNGYKILLDNSYGSINNQVLRASRLHYVVQRRVQVFEKKVSA